MSVEILMAAGPAAGAFMPPADAETPTPAPEVMTPTETPEPVPEETAMPVTIVQGASGVTTDPAGTVNSVPTATADPVEETAEVGLAPVVALSKDTVIDLHQTVLQRLDNVLHAFEHVSVTVARDLVQELREDLRKL